MTDRAHWRLSRPQSISSILSGTIDPVPLTYHGVLMRSTLETDFARHLDHLGVPWLYEPRVFGVKGSGYLPDFQVTTDDGVPCYVEVKPTLAEVPLAKQRMEVIWDHEINAVLLVACAEGSRFFAASSLPSLGWVEFTEVWKHA